MFTVERQCEYLQNGLEPLGIILSADILKKLILYKNKVLEMNKKFNLTAIEDEPAFIELHLIDSLSLIPYIRGAEKILDIGTGAGFPGAVLNIAMPGANFTFIEASEKKLNFVKNLLSELGEKNGSFFHDRAESAGKNPAFREQFDCVIARGVAPLSILLEYALPLVSIGGSFYAMKGKNAHGELSSAGNASQTLGADTCKRIDVRLPYSDMERCILVYEKKAATPHKYPRNFSAMKAGPLN